MSQNNISFDGSMTGASMLDERLTPLLNNLYSSNSGSTRPSYLQAGGTWFDSPNGKLMLFNGISEIPLSTLMTATETEAVTGSDDTKAMTPLGTTKVVGIGKYYVTRTYAEDDVVLNVDDGEIKLYQSLIDNNVGNPLTDATKWKKVSLGGGGGEIGDMGFAPLGIDESLNLRRYLNGQVIPQSLSPAFTAKVKAAIALHSSLGTTEANWQAEITNSKLGQCGKFVIDDNAGTIRLPCVVNAQGLLSLSGIGSLVTESLPNITGSVNNIRANTGTITETGALRMIRALFGETAGGNVVNTGTILIDASLSSSTYQDNAPVQQEAVQYPYYIQVATGVEETLPAIREYEINTPFFFGQSMYSENAPYNASWLVSNGQYNAKTVYPDYYDWLVEQMNAGVSGFVASTATYTDYDFVINTTDQTFRLPLKNGQEGVFADGVKGNGMALGLTNGTVNYGLSTTGAPAPRLAGFTNAYGFNVSVTGGGVNNGEGNIIGLTTDPTKSGMIVDKTVPSGWNLYYYVGDTVQDASLINAGVVLGQLANCIDRTVASDRETVVGWGMPDYTAGVSKSKDVEYTAEVSGWITLSVTNGTTNPARLTIDGVTAIYNPREGNLNNTYSPVFVGKGQKYKLTGSATVGAFVFYPCKGVN